MGFMACLFCGAFLSYYQCRVEGGVLEVDFGVFWGAKMASLTYPPWTLAFWSCFRRFFACMRQVSDFYVKKCRNRGFLCNKCRNRASTFLVVFSALFCMYDAICPISMSKSVEIGVFCAISVEIGEICQICGKCPIYMSKSVEIGVFCAISVEIDDFDTFGRVFGTFLHGCR